MGLVRKIHTNDNVLVAIQDLQEGNTLISDGVSFSSLTNIPLGHKIAARSISKGETIIKYGFAIGTAQQDIQIGAHVHTHNLKTNLNENLEYKYNPEVEGATVNATVSFPTTFMGYERNNGEVGIRNELWIVPTVGCVNGQAKQIIDLLKAETDTSHIDAIEVLGHPYGCSQLGDDHVNTQSALAAAIKHPNAGGVLILGLGCENNQIKLLQEKLGAWNEQRLRFLVAQKVEDEVESGLALVKELSEIMKTDKRTEVSISKLKIGLKCGGSDAFSGITANPLLGAFSDWLVEQEGATVLTEVPEMFGAETTLMNRAANPAIFNKTVDLINGFKDYFRKNDQEIYENPSPGNKEGGITTLEEKSLGAIQKGGNTTIVDVLNYGDQVQKSGLHLLWGPGNDLVSCAALGMAGCQMVLFTTGRGTPFGSFVPTVKIASNSILFHRKQNWMDFNAGSILENDTMEVLLNKFIHYLLDVANGKALKHEIANFKEIAIFKSGVTL